MSTPRHDCKTDDRKLAIDRPCSACSDGDSEMEYHDHCPPFREGVAAPLEPTQCPSCTGSKDMALCADVFHSPKGVRQTYDSPDGAESSEPNRQEFEKWANHPDRRLHLDWDGERYELYEVELCWQAYRTAAAVSKNLQEELAAMRTRWNFTLKGEDEALRECRRLEKEIAALRRL